VQFIETCVRFFPVVGGIVSGLGYGRVLEVGTVEADVLPFIHRHGHFRFIVSDVGIRFKLVYFS